MAESAAEAPNVVIGTFMVNTHPATVLFILVLRILSLPGLLLSIMAFILAH
jgi:hypothetical protein